MRTVAGFPRFASPTLLVLAAALLAGCFVAACSPAKEVNYTPPGGSTGPAINHFSFSKMIVDGKEFNEMDIVISSDGKVAPWQIGTVHVVVPADIEALINPSTRVLIIGTGANGVSKVEASALARAEAKGVKVHVLDTVEAVKLFNGMPKEGLVAAFHTGC
ncbi:MAG: hypothetical protein GY697_18400 [Desulfobacterales bacterium]|nr:hypothetical protein [Desulfobacterales bacterium]